MRDLRGQGHFGLIFFIFFVALIVFISLQQFPSYTYFIFFIVGCIVFFLSFLNPNLILILVILSALLSPEFQVGGIAGRSVVIRLEDIFLFFIFLGWLAKLSVNKELGLVRFTPLNRAIAVYLFLCIVSTAIGLISQTVTLKQSFFYLLKYFEYFMIFFLVVNNLRTMRQAKLCVFFMIITCIIVCLYALLSLPSGGRLSAPFEGVGGEPNTFAGYLVLMMALMIGLMLYNKQMWLRVPLGILLFCSMGIFIFTFSRGGWLAFFPMVGAFIFFDRRHRNFLIFSCLAVAFLFPFISPQRMQERIQERIKDAFSNDQAYEMFGKELTVSGSTAARIESWGMGFALWLKRPLVGYGIPSAGVIDNQYIRVLTETGILGFLAFLHLLRSLFRVGLRSWRESAENGFSQGVCLGFLAALVGLVTHALSVSTFIVIRIMEPFWFWTAIVVLLPTLVAQEKKEEAGYEETSDLRTG
ncbi:MAG: O-antigen ligase family protein [Candidatus Omnitrophica bacterium]|nr:O-antigen ligase family protein [Candidatus Omnitrophota bacterium]